MHRAGQSPVTPWFHRHYDKRRRLCLRVSSLDATLLATWWLIRRRHLPTRHRHAFDSTLSRQSTERLHSTRIQRTHSSLSITSLCHPTITLTTTTIRQSNLAAPPPCTKLPSSSPEPQVQLSPHATHQTPSMTACPEAQSEACQHASPSRHAHPQWKTQASAACPA